jgi:DNA-binding NarL/FixJ family response regulator
MDPIRILIADDHPVFRFGLQALLRAEPGAEIVGEATNGDEAVALAAATQPDVIVMDVNMPGLNGIEATRRILDASPHIGILIVTMFDDESVFGAMRAGARGYLLKGSEAGEMLRAIRAVGRGEAVFSPAVARRVIDYFANPSLPPPSQTFAGLTEREREILGLLAHGYTNAAIAERLELSPKTVRNHVSNIFGKLQVADRAQAILRARAVGLGK